MSHQEVVICHLVRTAIGTYDGSLKGVPATDVGATAIRETLRRSRLDAEKLGGVIMGNVIQAGNKMNPTRQAAVAAGVPVAVPVAVPAQAVHRPPASEGGAHARPAPTRYPEQIARPEPPDRQRVPLPLRSDSRKLFPCASPELPA